MGGKGSAPAAPDYTGAAQAQAQASKENLNVQNYANRPVINTPFGTQSWGTQAVVDPATGQNVTQWTQNTTLAPGLQSALEDQMGIQAQRSNLASGFMDRVRNEYGSQFDYSQLPAFALSNGSSTALPQFDSGYRDQVAQSLMERMMPVQERQQSQLETQLANQGFRTGAAATKTARDELGQRQAAERYNALDAAGAEAQRLYNMQMGSRQQSFNENAALAAEQNRLRQAMIAEQAQRRGMSLNEMNALLSGQQVSMPTMPSFAAAGQAQTPNLLGAMQSTYDAQMGAYNAQQAGNANLMGGLFSLGASALGGPAGGVASKLFGF